MFCACGIQFRPLIRTYRNIYLVCTCGNLTTIKRRLWFVHYTRSIKAFFSAKFNSHVMTTQVKQNYDKNIKMCVL